MGNNSSLNVCALCSADVSRHPIIEGMHAFCCAGCRAVFTILSAKNELSGFSNHPIFLQALKTGLISNPALLEQIHRQRASLEGEEREKLYLEIGNMWCPSCAEIIKLVVLNNSGVTNCVVDYTTDLASIEFSPRHISKERILEIVSSFGYEPKSLDATNRKAVSFDLYLRFIVAAFCSLNIMMLAYPLYATYFDYDGEGYGSLFAWISMATSLPILVYSAMPIWRRFLNSFKVGLYGMETLVAIGVGSAFAFSFYQLYNDSTNVYFDSMSVVIVFVLLGKIIEARAKFSAKESLMRLSRSTPKRGRKLFADRSLEFVITKEISKGDTLVVYTGEKIVLDGVVTAGSGAVDESLMTGEAIPVVKSIGSRVLGGTILSQGELQYQVTAGDNETALQRIIEMVEQDIGHKSLYVRAADRIVKWFVPLVLFLAAITGLSYMAFAPITDMNPSETAFLRALAVLLISCPCAIGIAAPTAESHLMNGLAALGAIVRNRGCLSNLGKETVIIFDKTGTVTEGCYRVHSGLEKLSEQDTKAIYALCSRSTHPVARALAEATKSPISDEIKELSEVVGFGMQATVGLNRYLIGSKRHLEQQGVSCLEEKNDSNLSYVYMAKDGVCIAVVGLGDSIKGDMPDLINGLSPVKTILLSGDTEAIVRAVAKHCNFNEWKSGCTPIEKRDYIEKLKETGHIVTMVGDGINDAPALTAAHIGISVVSATDMSIQVSDMLLTTDRLHVLLKIRALAVRGHKIIKQNLFWAFAYNVAGIGLAAFGLLTPIYAAAAMSISSITVLFNARRL